MSLKLRDAWQCIKHNGARALPVCQTSLPNFVNYAVSDSTLYTLYDIHTLCLEQYVCQNAKSRQLSYFNVAVSLTIV